MSIIENTKNDLKRILPPPVNSFMREINIVKAELTRLRSELREENRKLLDELRGIREDNAKQTGELSRIYNAIPEKPVLWLNEFERGVVLANWGKVTETPDFKEKCLHLISGLDRASVIVINRIIARQKKYLDTEKKELALFTREEQEELRLLSVACAVNTNYYQRILGTGI